MLGRVKKEVAYLARTTISMQLPNVHATQRSLSLYDFIQLWFLGLH